MSELPVVVIGPARRGSPLLRTCSIGGLSRW